MKKKHYMPTPDNILTNIRGFNESTTSLDQEDGLTSSLV